MSHGMKKKDEMSHGMKKKDENVSWYEEKR